MTETASVQPNDNPPTLDCSEGGTLSAVLEVVLLVPVAYVAAEVAGVVPYPVVGLAVVVL